MGKRTQSILLATLTSLVALAGCDVAPGVAPTLKSGALLAQIDDVGPSSISGGVLSKLNPVSNGDTSRWTQYIAGISRECGGAPPAGLAFESVDLALAEGGTFKDLAQVFSGPVSIQLKDDDSGLRATIASRHTVAGTGTVPFNVIGNRPALDPILSALLDGRFSVGLVGTTTLATDFNISFRIGVRVRGYCPDAEAATAP